MWKSSAGSSPPIAKVMTECRRRKIPTVATKLTVLTDLDGTAIGLGQLARLRPFFVQDGFRDGTPGQAVIPQLPRPDHEVRKWSFSAMHQTDLEKFLHALRADRLVFTGISTNGAVEGTARDALMRDYQIVTLSDCVTGYDEPLREAALKSLAYMGTVMTSDQFLRELGA
jgi:nicotinamidase-related amidase